MSDFELPPDVQLLIRLFLRDPEAVEVTNIVSGPTDNNDGSYSFIVQGISGDRWKHTIRTEEVPPVDPSSDQG